MNIDFKKLREQVEKIEKAGEIEKILMHETAYNRFVETVCERENQNALLYMGASISYKDLLTLVDKIAVGFSKIGIKKNEIVTVSTLCTPYAIAIFYALDKIGATQHLVNCASSIEEVKREVSNIRSKYFIANDLFCNDAILSMLKEMGVEYIITTSLLDAMPKGINGDKIKCTIAEKAKGAKKNIYSDKVMTINQLISKFCYNENVPAVSFEYDHNATIAYTSGSTGNSKACVATWEAIDSIVQVMGMTEQGRFVAGDIMLSTFPLWIYYSLLNMIHEPLCLGVTLALDPLFDPKNLVKRNRQYKFNHWLTIPPYLKKVLDYNKPTDCSKWKIVLTGGAELHDDIKLGMDKYILSNGGNTKVVQGYGASECLGCFAYCYYPDSTLGCLGKPSIGNMIKIVDVDTRKELGPNETGVGYFYGPSLMKCYYGDEQATNHNLVKDENGIVWYNTEDLIHVNEKGEIFLDGRLRRIALSIDANGNPTKIIPERVKKELQNHSDVEKCEVITIPDSARENVSLAFVVKKNNVEKEELIKHCELTVPEYMVPIDIVFIEDIPLTPANKPDLKALENIYNEKIK